MIELALVYEVDHGVGVAGEFILFIIKQPTTEATVVMAMIMVRHLGGTGCGGSSKRGTFVGLIFR